jgi:hypothetical protein
VSRCSSVRVTCANLCTNHLSAGRTRGLPLAAAQRQPDPPAAPDRTHTRTGSVILRVWITSGCCGRPRSAKVFLPHSRWGAQRQADGSAAASNRGCPQRCAQAAHSVSAVSAEAIHRGRLIWSWRPARRPGN